MAEKKRVLIVHNYYMIPGGEDTVVANESQMLQSNGYEVVLYTRSNTELKNMNFFQRLLFPFSTVFNLKTFIDVRHIIKNKKIDIVHVHNTLSLISPSVYYAARSCGVPVVQSVHNFRLLCPGAVFYREGHICEDCAEHGLICAFKHKCYRNNRIETLGCIISTKIHRLSGIYKKINYICLTEFNKNKLLCIKQIKEKNIYIKPNFIEPVGMAYSKDERNEEYVVAGRLEDIKGIKIIFEAWGKMGDKAPKLIVYGTGPLESWCKNYIDSNHVNIELRGQASSREVLSSIKKSRGVILANQTYEGFGMNIVEAFSSGTPVICSDLGNPGNLVEEGVTGCKFICNNPYELINAIERSKLLDYNNCWLDYERKYLPEKNMEMLARIYDSCLDNRDDNKERVLIVHNYYNIPGGEDIVVANEKRLLESNGHYVKTYTRKNAELNEMYWHKKLLLPVITVFNTRTYRNIKRLIKEKHIDIVHVHNTLGIISPAVYYAAWKCKVPVVQTVHNFRMICPAATLYRDDHICEDCISNGLHQALKHKCYRDSFIQTLGCVTSLKVHRILGTYSRIKYICLTEFNKEKLMSLHQINEGNIFVKPNFTRSERDTIAKENRENQYIFAGRLDKLKGVDKLFEAWNKMGKNAPKLIVCGMGPMSEWCFNFINENDCNIDLKGLVDNKEVLEIIARSKGAILPTQWYEGFPMNIVESFSVGTPVICSDLGNTGDIVEEGVTGCKFRHDDIDDIIRAVRKSEEIDYNRCYREYEQKYSEAVNYRLLMDIYHEVEKC